MLLIFQYFKDGTAVVITFAESIDGKDTKLAAGKSTTNSNVSQLQILGVKDAAGNLLKEFTAADGINQNPLSMNTPFGLANISTTAAYAGLKAELVDTETLKVKFTAGINDASTNAFTAVDGAGDSIIDSVQIDGTSTVTLKLKKNKVGTDGTGLNLVVDFTKLVTIAGNTAAVNTPTATISKNALLLETVAPEITNTLAYGFAGNVVTLTYSEALAAVTGASQDLKRSDFTIVRISDNKELNPIGDYDVSIAGTNNNEIAITLTDGSTVNSAYRVTVNGAKYFTDASVAKNKISDSVGLSEVVSKTSDTVALINALAAVNAATGDTLEAALGNPALGLDLTNYKHLNSDQRVDMGHDFVDAKTADFKNVAEIQAALNPAVLAQALKEIIWAANNGDWTGAKVSMFTAAGVTGVTTVNYDAVKAALEAAKANLTTKANIQTVVSGL